MNLIRFDNSTMDNSLSTLNLGDVVNAIMYLHPVPAGSKRCFSGAYRLIYIIYYCTFEASEQRRNQRILAKEPYK